MAGFFQDGPVLGNQYQEDSLLCSYLSRVLPREILAEIEPDLLRFGERTVAEILQWGDDAEANPPELVQYDSWGRRTDRVITSRGWKMLDRISAEEGLVAIGYERQYGACSRLYQFAKLYLFHPSSAIYSCPLAMTDGAARLIEVFGDAELPDGPFHRLTSRDPKRFWTSGQWMTERTGGSDLADSETVARFQDGQYRLYGDKWFTSAVTAQMAMTLARIVDKQGNPAPGSRGLSLFFLENYRDDGPREGIRINRLKDKLGTRALPTAELTLDGARAMRMGEPGNGVKKIATLFNITRIYNACCAVAAMRRMLALSRDYAHRRRAFGVRLSTLPLHLETLAAVELEYAAAFHLVFHVVRLLGREECGQAGPEDAAILRLLTPLAKLYTAKQAIAAVSELIESIGGAGYVEDTGIPRFLRDCQTLSIWEGTTNVLSLDALRAIQKERALEPFLADVAQRTARVTHPALAGSAAKVKGALGRIKQYALRTADRNLETIHTGARGFAYALARTFMASLLLEHAQWSIETETGGRHLIIARRWCAGDLTPLREAGEGYRAESRALALDLPFTVRESTLEHTIP